MSDDTEIETELFNQIVLDLKPYYAQLHISKFVKELRQRVLPQYIDTENSQKNYERFRDKIELLLTEQSGEWLDQAMNKPKGLA